MTEPHREKKNPSVDLTNEEVVYRLLLSDNPADQQLLLQTGATPEALEVARFYAKLRKQVHESKQRNELEPQVATAVSSLRKKGYDTKSSGFLGPIGWQHINWTTPRDFPEAIRRDIEAVAKQNGVTLELKPRTIQFLPERQLSIEQLTHVWNELAKAMPEVGVAV